MWIFLFWSLQLKCDICFVLLQFPLGRLFENVLLHYQNTICISTYYYYVWCNEHDSPYIKLLLSITNKCAIFLKELVGKQDTKKVEIPKYVSLKCKNQETWLRVHIPMFWWMVQFVACPSAVYSAKQKHW